MLKDLSLNVLDIVENSAKAGASLIFISVREYPLENVIKIEIKDNGCGISADLLEALKNPQTIKKKINGGLGIPLFSSVCVDCGGDFVIDSEEGMGTRVLATVPIFHERRAPIGDLSETFFVLVIMHENIRFCIECETQDFNLRLDTKDMREVLKGKSFLDPLAINWLKARLKRRI